MGRTLIVCDASPLIFLAKLGELELVGEVLGPDEAVVLRCVVDEVLQPCMLPSERKAMERFLGEARIVDFEAGGAPSEALSRSDRSSLAWAVENRAEWMLVDERLLRRCALAEGIRVVGFLGLMLAAVRRRLRRPDVIRGKIDDAVAEHGCRISVGLYQALLRELERDAG